MKTKAFDQLRLPDGTVTTLKAALDSGVLHLIESGYYNPPRYFARDRDNTVSWEVGKMLYLSRTGQALLFRK